MAKTAWKVIVGVLVAVLLLVLVAEFGVRWYIGKQMTEEFRAQAPQAVEDPSVSFGASPVVFGLLQREIPHLEMTTPSTLQIEGQEITGQPASTVVMDGLSLGEDPVARDFAATTVIPDDYLLVTFQNAIMEQSGSDMLGTLVVTDIVANQAEGALDIELGKGLATLTLVPAAADGTLALTATNSTLFGIELPQQATDSISEALRNGVTNDFTGGMNVDDIEVRDGELAVRVTGHNVNFNELSQQY